MKPWSTEKTPLKQLLKKSFKDNSGKVKYGK